MVLHPFLDLSEENVLGLGLPKEVIQLDGGLGFCQHRIKSLVFFEQPVLCLLVCQVGHFFALVLVVEPLEIVSELWLVHLVSLRLCHIVHLSSCHLLVILLAPFSPVLDLSLIR